MVPEYSSNYGILNAKDGILLANVATRWLFIELFIVNPLALSAIPIIDSEVSQVRNES